MSVDVMEDARPVLHVPAAYRPYLDNLLFWVEKALRGSPEQRRKITRGEPLLFALVYFPDALKSDETGGRYSICQMHIDMCEEATAWGYPHGPQEYRCAWIGPRDSGKTTWHFSPGILPMWALATGVRMDLLLLAASGKRAGQHFRGIRNQLKGNTLLRLDYPELCTPTGKAGSDTETQYLSVGGHSISAQGMDSEILGHKEGYARPGLIVIDDAEQTGARYSLAMKSKRLRMLREMVFPMNLNAVVVIVGTVTRYGSIMHEVVRAASGGEVAEWIIEENIRCKYYPAIVMNEHGREESFWEIRWPYSWMQTQRHTDMFRLNQMNMPLSQGGVMWTPEDYQYDPPWLVETQVLSIDPAMKSNEWNDPTGLAVIGFDSPKWNALVQWAEGVRLPPEKLRELVASLLTLNPRITHVIIETNQGGDWVVNTLKPVIPKWIKIELIHEDPNRSKPIRFKELHDWNQMKWVWHGPGLHALETQELAYPDVEHDDIIDAVAKGVRHGLKHRPIPRPA